MNKYKKSDVISFASTKSKYGKLSNMCAGLPLLVNDTNIKTVEALYQACKFPLFPEIQKLIIDSNSPMTAKEISKEYSNFTRQDWEINNTKYIIMRWCLRLKLLQNYNAFSSALLTTEKRTIVEYSRKDSCWGALDFGSKYLEGKNALGLLLMQLRDSLGNEFNELQAPKISGFLLYDKHISTIYKTN